MLKIYGNNYYFIIEQMKVVVDKAIPFIGGVLEPYAEVVYLDGAYIDSTAIKDCDALIIRTRTHCDSRLLDGSNVRFIATATIGRDHIDERYCHNAGIAVYSAPGCNARGVLQWVASALHHIAVTDGRKPQDYTLGVVGVGNVGSLVVEYARAWGYRVLQCDPPRKEREGGDFIAIYELLHKADIITLHTPLDNTTRHLINPESIARMKPNAIVINASRGGVVDNKAMAESNHRYIFDVWEGEPKIDLEVLRRATLATPHIAGYSLQGKANATAMVVRAFAKHFGIPLTDWYPKDIEPTSPRTINWEELSSSIADYCDIASETSSLKLHPEEFEAMRNGYAYRQEYF